MTKSDSVISILEELEATSGSNAKHDILELHKDNELLKRVFVAAQDPYTVYYVSKFKMPPVNSGLLDGNLAWRQHNGGHEDRTNMSYFLGWADRLFHHVSPGPAVLGQ